MGPKPASNPKAGRPAWHSLCTWLLAPLPPLFSSALQGCRDPTDCDPAALPIAHACSCSSFALQGCFDMTEWDATRHLGFGSATVLKKLVR